MRNLPDCHIQKIDYDLKEFIYNHFYNNIDSFKEKLLTKKREYEIYKICTKDIDFILKYAHRIKVTRGLRNSINII